MSTIVPSGGKQDHIGVSWQVRDVIAAAVGGCAVVV
jgi:hypothetical protein